MATPYPLFSNYTLTATTADQGRLISFAQDWIGVIVSVSSVGGTAPSAEFRVQWSNDGATWFDPPVQDVIGTATATGTFVGRFTIKAPYWRVGAVVTGTTPSLVCSASALV